MHGSSFLLGPSSFDRRNKEKISLFRFSLLSLSLSLYPFPLPSLLFSFLFSLIQRTPLCLLLLIFLFLFSSHFLISFFFPSLSFPSLSLFSSHPILSSSISTEMIPKVGETSPPPSPLPLVTLTFFLNFLYLSFP